MSSCQLISPAPSFLGWLLLLWFGHEGPLAWPNKAVVISKEPPKKNWGWARSINPKMNTIRVDLPWALGNNAFIRKK